MPIYEYECDACHKRFEKLQKASDPLLTACPKCGGAIHKCFSVPAIQFKGSGWYVTDYGRKSGNASSGGNAKGKPSPSKKAEAKTGGSTNA